MGVTCANVAARTTLEAEMHMQWCRRILVRFVTPVQRKQRLGARI